MVRKRTQKKTRENASKLKGSEEESGVSSKSPPPTVTPGSLLPDIELDGVRMKIEAPDIDGDGVTGGVERVQSNYGKGVTPIIQPAEMGEILKAMNDDVLDPDTSMRSIDMKTRINWLERNSIAALDTVSHMHVCRPTILTHVLKRLNVSISGLGREENLKAIVGEREHRKESNGMFGGLKDKLGGK